MGVHVPAEELLAPEGLAALQRHKLSVVLEHARRGGFYAAKLAGCAFDAACDPLTALPLTTRAELDADQQRSPPFGTVLTEPVEAYCRYHQTSASSGAPLRWLDTAASWEWWKHCWAIVYRAAGLRAGDRVAFPFSFGPFIGFWSAFESAAMLGNLCLPAGGMTTAARVRYVVDNGVTIVCCTPTYALRMVEVAAEAGIDLTRSAVRGLIVAGEPGGSIPAVRAQIEEGWGARVFDHAGMTELGAWGFECAERPGGVHVCESEFVAEVIDPERGAPRAEGETGELVLTGLGRLGSPLIRYRTGDVVRLTRERCACGRWFARAEGGVLGRVDDMLIVRGNNVFPAAIEGIVREFAEVAEFRMEAVKRGALRELVVDIEPRAGGADDLGPRVAAAIRDRLHFQATVRVVPAGTLPRFEMKARRVVRGERG